MGYSVPLKPNPYLGRISGHLENLILIRCKLCHGRICKVLRFQHQQAILLSIFLTRLTLFVTTNIFCVTTNHLGKWTCGAQKRRPISRKSVAKVAEGASPGGKHLVTVKMILCDISCFAFLSLYRANFVVNALTCRSRRPFPHPMTVHPRADAFHLS